MLLETDRHWAGSRLFQEYLQSPSRIMVFAGWSVVRGRLLASM
jgi:hypothetical protein